MKYKLRTKVSLLFIIFALANPIFLGCIDFWPFEIFALLSLILVPGTLISYLVDLPKEIVWFARLGFGILAIYGLGLATNTVLQLFGITTPLSASFLIPIFDTSVLLLTIVNLLRSDRNTKLPTLTRVTIPKKQVLLLAAYAVLPILSYLGATVLNNGGSNFLSILSLVLIPILVILTLLFKQPRILLYVVGLFSIGLALIWAYSLRSNYLIGWDIQSELHAASSTITNHIWTAHAYDAYGATLSLTILPAVLHVFTGISTTSLFKVAYPVLAACMLPVVFLLASKYASRKYAFLIAFFFASQQQFMHELPALVRQQIAFYFFMLVVYFILDSITQPKFRRLLIIVFSLGVIVSHYSTGYVLIAALLIGSLIVWILDKFHIRARSTGATFPSWIIILTLMFFTIMWYGQITNSTGDIKGALTTTARNLTKLGEEDNRSNAAQGALFNSSTSNSTLAQLYGQSLTTTERKYLPNSHTADTGGSSQAIPIRNDIVFRVVSIYDETDKAIIKFALFLGGALWVFRIFRRKSSAGSVNALALSASFLILILAIAILPSISLFYNFERMYQQGLPLLGLMIVLGICSLAERLKLQRLSLALVAILFVGYYLDYSALLTQFTGGQPSVTLANYGSEYDEYYRHYGEDLTANWLLSKDSGDTTYTDAYSGLKLLSYIPTPRTSVHIFNSLNSSQPLLLSTANVRQQLEYQKVQGDTVILQYPTSIIDSHKSLVYANGQSEIYQ